MLKAGGSNDLLQTEPFLLTFNIGNLSNHS